MIGNICVKIKSSSLIKAKSELSIILIDKHNIHPAISHFLAIKTARIGAG